MVTGSRRDDPARQHTTSPACPSTIAVATATLYNLLRRATPSRQGAFRGHDEQSHIPCAPLTTTSPRWLVPMAKPKKARQQPAPTAVPQEQSFVHPRPTGDVWTYLPLWLLVAFVLRAAVALAGDFLLHPDEIMQYLEPAHRLVFGNGVMFWEHYYGARSWIMPGLIAGVLWLCALVGLDEPHAYIAVVKLFFCALSLLIPLGMYLFCRRHWDERSARLALVLGVFWYELVAFAHKPMTEFVAAALMCALLAVMPLHAPAQAWRWWAAAGVVGALAVAVRFQYAPLIGVILLVGVSRAPTTGRLAMLGGGAVVVCAVGALETLHWGMPFYSYWGNVVANLGLDEIRVGESPPWMMSWQLLHASGGLLAVAAAGVVGHVRRRGFVLGLLVLLVILHILPNHREYRFIFAAVPLWLMVFADVVAVASERATPAGTWIRHAGAGVAVLVSVAGMFNAIPGQNGIYKSFSKESSHFNFLRTHDPGLQLYRRLSEDDTVHGLLDASAEYETTGGYYYLHRAIPFYDRVMWNKVAGDHAPADYFSHIITRTSAGGGHDVTAREVNGNTVRVLKTDYGHERYPAFIADSDSGELVYWSNPSSRRPQPDYVMVDQAGDLVLWKRQPAHPVKQWRGYQISTFSSPDTVDFLQRIIFGHELPDPPPHHGIAFVDD